MTTRDGESVDQPGGGRLVRWLEGLLAFLLVVVVFAAAFLYIATEGRIGKLKAEAAAERARIEARETSEREALSKRAAAEQTARAKKLLTLSALPLSWAIRSSLQEKDFHQIGVYLHEFVALGGVERAAVVLRDGIAKVATDKKLEGRPAAEAFSAARISDDAPTVRGEIGEPLEAVIPIMGLNARLGTLIIDYEAPR